MHHKIWIAGAFVALIGAGCTTAPRTGSVHDISEPAEFPPVSFTGLQYVDSRGCAYVRAGAEGAVVWVPRVTRSRQAVCGMTPSATVGL